MVYTRPFAWLTILVSNAVGLQFRHSLDASHCLTTSSTLRFLIFGMKVPPWGRQRLLGWVGSAVQCLGLLADCHRWKTMTYSNSESEVYVGLNLNIFIFEIFVSASCKIQIPFIMYPQKFQPNFQSLERTLITSNDVSSIQTSPTANLLIEKLSQNTRYPNWTKTSWSKSSDIRYMDSCLGTPTSTIILSRSWRCVPPGDGLF